MIRNFIGKEIFESIVGPKFLITFMIAAVLIITSVFTGYQIYREEVSWHATAKSENIKALTNLGSYGNLKSEGSKAIRPPSRMSIFIKGVDSTVGKASTVTENPGLVLRDSRFGLNPIFAVFGELDLNFIVTLILSLFALLFSYNAISGERELGTLKQVLSNPIGRAGFIVGKSVGGLVILAITLLVPFLLALLMLMVFFGVNFSGDEWIRIGMMTLAFFLYLAVFYMIGMLMSALTRNSFVSFLLCLFVWVLSVAIIPKISVEVAGQISPAPSIDELESERSALRREYYENLQTMVGDYFKEEWDGDNMEFGNAFQRAFQRALADARQIQNGKEEPMLQAYERKQVQLLHTAEAIARLSPTSCVTFATGRLAHTDAEMRERFLEALRRYREEYVRYADEKVADNPDKSNGGINVSLSQTDSGAPDINVSVPQHKLEVSDLPEFSVPEESVGVTAVAITPDLAILAIELIIFFAAAFVAFIRYDVR